MGCIERPHVQLAPRPEAGRGSHPAWRSILRTSQAFYARPRHFTHVPGISRMSQAFYACPTCTPARPHPAHAPAPPPPLPPRTRTPAPRHLLESATHRPYHGPDHTMTSVYRWVRAMPQPCQGPVRAVAATDGPYAAPRQRPGARRAAGAKATATAKAARVVSVSPTIHPLSNPGGRVRVARMLSAVTDPKP